jgi:ectoine hydroxylase-related dioxygenase (phytanoyl-CoA dioxygenase family)
MNKHIEDLKRDGVTILKSVYNKKEINELNDYTLSVETEVNTSINTNTINSKKYKYYSLFDKEYCHEKIEYKLSKYNIIEVAKGRLDIEIINQDIYLHKKIKNIIHHFFTKHYTSHMGILTSQSMSDTGIWHRDVVNICGESDKNGNYDDSKMVHDFEPFYFNVLLPLVPLNNENGSTEFILGSHKTTYNESIDKKRVQYNTDIGDVIIFDGRIFHRGRENKTNMPRTIIYNVYHRSWYNDN